MAVCVIFASIKEKEVLKKSRNASKRKISENEKIRDLTIIVFFEYVVVLYSVYSSWAIPKINRILMMNTVRYGILIGSIDESSMPIVIRNILAEGDIK